MCLHLHVRVVTVVITSLSICVPQCCVTSLFFSVSLSLSLSHTHTHTEASTEADLKRLKLCYTDPHFQSVETEASETWNRILAEKDQDETVILKALLQGIKQSHCHVNLTTSYRVYLTTTTKHYLLARRPLTKL